MPGQVPKPLDAPQCKYSTRVLSLYKGREPGVRRRRNIVPPDFIQQPSIADTQHLSRSPSVPTSLRQRVADRMNLRRRTQAAQSSLLRGRRFGRSLSRNRA